MCIKSTGILESVVREMSDSHRCTINSSDEAMVSGADDYVPSQYRRLK